MPRKIEICVPVDTCMFSSLQLQPVTAMRLAMTIYNLSITQQLADFPTLLKKYGVTFVVVGAKINYLAPLDFFSTASLFVKGGNLLRNNGGILQTNYQLSPIEKSGKKNISAIEMEVFSRPIKIQNIETLDAEPTNITGELRSKFQDDEIDDRPVPRLMNQQINQLRENATLIKKSDNKFRVSREDCEMADQWQFILLPSFVGRSRENLIFSSQDKRLSYGLSQPIQTWNSQWYRPMFLGAEGQVTTEAYWKDPQLYFIHEVHRKLPFETADKSQTFCAIALETFNAS